MLQWTNYEKPKLINHGMLEVERERKTPCVQFILNNSKRE